MSQDIVQWLAEIKALNAQLNAVKADLSAAHESANQWRDRYETEATQRRQETGLTQAQLAQLQTQLETYQQQAQVTTAPRPNAEIKQQVDGILNLEDLKQQLVAALQAQSQLTQSLKAEKIAHDRTRQDLTMALSDTMDALKKSQNT